MVGIHENGIIPSFIIHDDHAFPFRVINNEHNPAVFKREDGSHVTQCECIVYADRNDNRKGWLFFLELKYCEAKNRYDRMLEGISQLKMTCNYILKEKQELESSLFNKRYLVVSTPGVEPLDVKFLTRIRGGGHTIGSFLFSKTVSGGEAPAPSYLSG